MKNSPKTILITGASSGLGAALALRYAAPDVTLCLQGRDGSRLSSVAARCQTLGATVHTGLIDIRDRDVFYHWAQGLDHRFAIDLVIANAGISAGSAGLDGYEPISQAYEVFQTNLIGILTTIDPILPGMIRRQSGQIALVSSMASFLSLPGAAAYSASKAAVRSYGEALGGQLKPKGISVSVICPGFIKTPMTDVNDYPMPMLMSADRAASIIVSALESNQARIVFPKIIYAVMVVINLLPFSLRQLLLSRAPQKRTIQR